jgi:hypothetical protein
MRLTTKGLFKLISLLIGVILVVGVLILFNFNRVALRNELAALDLIPKPEKLTELYFNNHANLPHSATRNQQISFAFVIHNLETTDYQYVYTVSVDMNGTRHLVDTGNILVKNGQYYVKSEKFNLLDSSASQKVVVELTNKQQAIHFWVGKVSQ